VDSLGDDLDQSDLCRGAAWSCAQTGQRPAQEKCTGAASVHLPVCCLRCHRRQTNRWLARDDRHPPSIPDIQPCAGAQREATSGTLIFPLDPRISLRSCGLLARQRGSSHRIMPLRLRQRPRPWIRRSRAISRIPDPVAKVSMLGDFTKNLETHGQNLPGPSGRVNSRSDSAQGRQAG